VFKSNAELHFIEGLPLLTLPKSGRPRSTSLVKRAIDLSVAGAGLVVLSPYFAYVGFRIKIDSRGPVLFRQPRIGQDGETFNVIKFRTMCADADARKNEIRALNERTDGMFKVENDPRITRFGAKLRRASLDELPQLINVVRGEMSLVGPRPLIQPESDLVNEHYLARFNVRPGITGPWQVLGRSDIPFEDMLKLDYTYVTNWSVADDTKLLVRTVSAIAHGRGAY
jgi:lipopolysaccharide/colanic/teichoic acid biosynthesis glycosyltransferase